MFDWMTWSIEAVGIVILCIWIVVPIGEFKTIFRRLKLSDSPGHSCPGLSAAAESPDGEPK